MIDGITVIWGQITVEHVYVWMNSRSSPHHSWSRQQAKLDSRQPKSKGVQGSVCVKPLAMFPLIRGAPLDLKQHGSDCVAVCFALFAQVCLVTWVSMCDLCYEQASTSSSLENFIISGYVFLPQMQLFLLYRTSVLSMWTWIFMCVSCTPTFDPAF